MSDLCDSEFFNQHVWPLLLKDVRLLLADEGIGDLATIVSAIAIAVEKQFVARQFRMAQLTAHNAGRDARHSPERDNRLAGMQAYALMYEATMSTARALIEDKRPSVCEEERAE